MRAMLTICLGAMAFCASGIRAAEEPIALDKLPKAVLETVKKRFPKAELVEAAKETDGDKVEFEVTLKDGDTKYDVMLTPDGKITLIEKVIAAKDLPKVVAAALEEKYPKATYKGKLDDIFLRAGRITATLQDFAVDADVAEFVDDDGQPAALRVTQ